MGSLRKVTRSEGALYRRIVRFSHRLGDRNTVAGLQTGRKAAGQSEDKIVRLWNARERK